MGFPSGWKNGWKKKLHDRINCDVHLCKLETYTYISLATIYGLTAITKILVAGWKHASFLCYSMGVRWFLRILGPKLELPSMSADSPYLRRLWPKAYRCHTLVAWSCQTGVWLKLKLPPFSHVNVCNFYAEILSLKKWKRSDNNVCNT